MKNLKRVFVLNLLLLANSCFGQTLEEPIFVVQYGDVPKLHARGLSTTKKKIFIAASDGKMYVYDHKSQKCTSGDSIGKIQYRDIVVSKNHVLLLASGDSSKTYYRSFKSGKTIINSFEGQFLDGIAYGRKVVFMMGDPIEGKFNLLFSDDHGISWQKTASQPYAKEGEAGFAASGTNVRVLSDKVWLFVSGGMDSRLFRTIDAGKTWTDVSMGFDSCESCGAYSFAILPDQTIVAVGGDYLKPDKGMNACRISRDGGFTWESSKVNLNGYRSNVIFNDGILYACGTNGIDISFDSGTTWKAFSTGNYFTMTIFNNQLVASTINGELHFFELASF
jgi:photosystem II stability/assembly factor-like uncharacterized protein